MAPGVKTVRALIPYISPALTGDLRLKSERNQAHRR